MSDDGNAAIINTIDDTANSNGASPQADSPAPPVVFEDHLSYYTEEPPLVGTGSYNAGGTGRDRAPRQLLLDRLYVGNLHPSVDEYALLQIFSKFGKVTKLDFLFHKSGPLKGKPRGYAFIEYGTPGEANKALTHANGKLLRGRKLVVTQAQQAPLDQSNGSSNYLSGGKHRRGMMESGRPTTLSLLKSGVVTSGRRGDATHEKIAMMEAKLRQIEASKPRPSSSSASPSTAPAPSTLPSHPSLPPKPIELPESAIQSMANWPRPPIAAAKLPSKPLPAKPSLPSAPALTAPASSSSRPIPSRPKLVGVKMGKPKPKVTEFS